MLKGCFHDVIMMGTAKSGPRLFNYAVNLEKRVRANHSLRQASLYSNRFLFTGREYNANFGFYEYRARAYHFSLGWFMSEDPKLFVRRAVLAKAGGDWSFAAHPDEAEFNLFRYCGNDPVDFTDPMGLDFLGYDSAGDYAGEVGQTALGELRGAE